MTASATIGSILVPATGDVSDAASLAAALAVARAFSAHIDVLHVRIDPIDAVLAMGADPGGTAALPGLIAKIERDAAEREAAVKQVFDAFCARENLSLLEAPAPGRAAAASAAWHVETGDDADTVVAFGMAADLVLAARGVEHDVTNRSVVEAALLETGRPLLLVGESGALPLVGGAVAIAWKATPQAARAVAAAMPFLMRAAEIVVITVDEGNGAADGDRLVRNLAWHGLRARSETLKSGDQDPADTLLEAAREKFGLLVMGGYGHSRLREWVFGGFTQRVLEDAPLPVLLAH